MRLAADRGSPYYDETLVPRAVIYLNNIRVDHVLEVSEEEGWVRHLPLNGLGSFADSACTEVSEIMSAGTVRIEIL